MEGKFKDEQATPLISVPPKTHTNLIDDFPNHPYLFHDNDDMAEMIESIQK